MLGVIGHPQANFPGVYVIENTVTKKVYVGSAAKKLRTRLRNHLGRLRAGNHRNAKLQNSWNKYGESVFSARILLVCSPSDCLMFEQRAIDTYDAVNTGYNISPTAGNCLGMKLSDEAKRKISEKAKGRGCTPSMREAVSRAHRGQVLSQAQRDAVSQAHKGKPKSPEHRAKISAALTGKSHSEATRAKIGVASKGRHPTDAQKARISEGVLRAYAETDLREKVATAGRGRKASDNVRAALDWTGRSHSETSKKKIGAASAKRTHSSETRAKISASLTGKVRGPYKPRVCVTEDSTTFNPNHDESAPLVPSQEE